ncbi:Hly-III related protein, partial [Cryphonectria parasitica EP155]
VSSWLYVHNETVNIYSHVIGALVFLVLPSYVFAVSIPGRYPVATVADVLVCSTYFLGVAVCFVLSTVFHTLMAHSPALYALGMKIDIQGVLVLMWSATVPLVYYTFQCEEGVVRAAYGIVFTALAGACSAVTFLKQFSGPHLGPYRAALFGAFGAGSFAAPITHGLLKHGLEEMYRRVGLGWILVTVVCNGIGIGVYGLKFPERWYPRRFDLFGASHQLMHVFVVAAALAYACAVVQAFDYRHGQGVVC